MAKLITDLLCIAVVLVFITDISGAVQSFEDFLRKLLNLKSTDIFRRHLYNCSLCQVWWAGLVYICITKEFTFVNIAVVALISSLTTTIQTVLRTVKSILDILLYKLNEKIDNHY